MREAPRRRACASRAAARALRATLVSSRCCVPCWAARARRTPREDAARRLGDPSALRSRTRSWPATLTPTLSRSSSSHWASHLHRVRARKRQRGRRECTPAQPHLGSSLTKAHHHAWFLRTAGWCSAPSLARRRVRHASRLRSRTVAQGRSDRAGDRRLVRASAIEDRVHPQGAVTWQRPAGSGCGPCRLPLQSKGRCLCARVRHEV